MIYGFSSQTSYCHEKHANQLTKLASIPMSNQVQCAGDRRIAAKLFASLYAASWGNFHVWFVSKKSVWQFK